MQLLLGYAWALKDDYGESYVDFCIMDVMDNMLSSKFLAANSTAAYVRYIRAGKMVAKHNGMRNLAMSLFRGVLALRTLGTTHCDEPSLYISSEADFLLIIQAADVFVKNNHKRAFFRPNVFYRHRRALLDGLLVYHSKQGEEKFTMLTIVLETRIQQKITH